MNKSNKTKAFFDNISPYYDGVVNFKENLSKRIKLLSGFSFDKQGTAADLGCGSGIDSIALTKIGFKVTGFDISGQMVKKAHLNAKQTGCKIKFVTSSLENIPKSYKGQFNLVISLGNTLANIDGFKLRKVFKNAYEMLKKTGDFLIQLVNIEMMKYSNKRIVGITKDTNNTYIRFYDFETEEIIFNVIRISNADVKNYDINSTKLFLYNKANLIKIAKQSGFKSYEIYGGLNKSNFQPNSSPDLVIKFNK